MNKHLLARGFGALLLASMGTVVSAQDDEEKKEGNERRVRIEITKNENGKTSHVTREFDLNNDADLHDALRELGITDEMSMFGNGGNMNFDLRGMQPGGLLDDMSLALGMPDMDAPEPPQAPDDQAYLGVYYTNYEAPGSKKAKDVPPVEQGAVITHVEKGTPADAAGIRIGDVVVSIDGAIIADGESLAAEVSTHQPGDEVNVVYYRGKQKKSVPVMLGTRPGRAEEAPALNWNWNGSSSDDGNDGSMAFPFDDGGEQAADRPFLGVMGGTSEDGQQGVRIGEVVKQSAAQKMGLKEGDVLRKLNGEELNDFGELAEKVGEMEPDSAITVEVVREGKTLTLKGTLGRKSGASSKGNGSFPHMAPMAPMPPMSMAPEDREDMRREMDQLRQEMNHLRRELRGDVVRNERVTVNSDELSKEELALLKGKGAAGLDQPLLLNELQCTSEMEQDDIHLTFQAPDEGDLEVDLRDGTGTRVYHESVSAFKGRYDRTIDVSDKADGTYYAVITQNGKSVARKVVK